MSTYNSTLRNKTHVSFRLKRTIQSWFFCSRPLVIKNWKMNSTVWVVDSYEEALAKNIVIVFSVLSLTSLMEW
ncbi:hypothetical protein cypCar_00045570 [Cyprinus carpio]|nr:hypothetical protein cypCar_00045570 [Cyprinus carpio]